MTATAWCGKWFFPQRGTLSLEGDRIGYRIGDRPEFDVTLAELEGLTWHWYSFGAAFEATVHGKRYFLSFLGPGNTSSSWWQGMRTGWQWRARMRSRMRLG